MEAFTQGSKLTEHLQNRAGWSDSLLAGASSLLSGSRWVKPLGDGFFSHVIHIESPLFNQKEVAFKVLPKQIAKDYPKVTQITRDRIGGEGLALFFEKQPFLAQTLGLLVQNESSEVSLRKDFIKLENETIYGVFSEYVPEMVTLETFNDDSLQKTTPENRKKIVSSIMKQILEALTFMHSKGIAYRDLKLDNILINPKTGQIKILDFGLARYLKSQSDRTTTMTGSNGYMAPEIYVGRPYNPFKADMFSLGVLLHMLTFDEFPDFPANECDPYEYGKFAEQYISEQDEGKGTITPYLPDEAKDHPLAVDLITMLTLGNPEKRPTPAEILNHPYFNP